MEKNTELLFLQFNMKIVKASFRSLKYTNSGIVLKQSVTDWIPTIIKYTFTNANGWSKSGAAFLERRGVEPQRK